jgi:Ala-tRNA(Pro) deacylase
MTIPASVKQYLDQQGIKYDVVAHAHTANSLRTAGAANVPADQLAKSVVVGDERGYVLAVIPATHRLDLGVLSRQMQRRLGLATEPEVGGLFEDCEFGAVPPLGAAYGIRMVVDESLTHCADVYFEAGDHTDLVHVSGTDFLRLIENAPRGQFSHHV